MRNLALTLFATTALTLPAAAQQDPNALQASGVNQNTRVVAYNPHARYSMVGNLGRPTILVFAPDEDVTRVLIGAKSNEPQTWEGPKPSAAGNSETRGTDDSPGNIVHLVPRAPGYTGITVITTSSKGQRAYQFAALARDIPPCGTYPACDDPQATYSLTFTYPADEAAERAAKAKAEAEQKRRVWLEEAPLRQARWEAQRTAAMSARLAQAPLMPGPCDNPFYEGEANAEGHQRIMPSSVYDNGQETFFVYRAGRQTPNFYTLASDGKSETPVLPVQRGPELLAIPVVADQIRLRLGDAVVYAYRRRSLPPECVSQTGTNDPGVARVLRRASAQPRPRT